MRGANRAAVVAGIVVAGVLTLAPARNGGAMTNWLVWGSQNVVQGANRVAVGMSRAVAELFNGGREWGAAPVSAQRQNGDESDQEAADFVWHGAVRTGQTVEIRGVNGDIIAERAAGGEIEIRAEKRARRSDVNAVGIEVVEHAGGVTLCAVYPSSRGRENTCEPGSRGGNSIRNNDVRVTFYVSVPENVAFLGTTVNGNVEVHSLASDVAARSVNGDIEISTTGFAEASTVNGSIDGGPELNLKTVNGSIHVF